MDLSVQKALPYYAFGILHSLATIGTEDATREKDLLARFRYAFMSGVPQSALQKHSKLIFLAVHQLAAEGLLELIRDDYADMYVKPKGDPFARIVKDQKLKELQEKFDSLGKHAPSWLSSAYFSIVNSADDELINAAINEIVSAKPENTEQTATFTDNGIEDTWQPLPIDRDEPTYQEAIAAADEALEVIEGNNGYAQSEPEERNGIVNSIKGTIAAIKQGTPSAATIKSGLIAPLQYLAKKFVDAAIGIASKVAVDKLIIWLLHLLGSA